MASFLGLACGLMWQAIYNAAGMTLDLNKTNLQRSETHWVSSYLYNPRQRLLVIKKYWYDWDLIATHCGSVKSELMAWNFPVENHYASVLMLPCVYWKKLPNLRKTKKTRFLNAPILSWMRLSSISPRSHCKSDSLRVARWCHITNVSHMAKVVASLSSSVKVVDRGAQFAQFSILSL